MEIRAMQPSDWPAVKEIYEQGIATRQATFEAAAPTWQEWDANHLLDLRLVAEDTVLMERRVK
jgi:phosphinothricin acetyltransferase